MNNESILGEGNLVVGIPKGLISMWSGSIATLPNGWFLCDGNNETPNLQDRFIYGTTVEEEIGQTGGSANAVVIAHSHTGSTNTTGNHSHSVTTYGGSSGSSGYNIAQVYGPVGAKNFSTASAGNHSHTLSINSSGEDGINKNLPPYYKLAFIMKG
ncbi:hypothetical protein CRU95_00885 [Arcobacter sp. F2176]|nr:hypothetical protein CRU95_00885 [Arcobacter sp. F2176]